MLCYQAVPSLIYLTLVGDHLDTAKWYIIVARYNKRTYDYTMNDHSRTNLHVYYTT